MLKTYIFTLKLFVSACTIYYAVKTMKKAGYIVIYLYENKVLYCKALRCESIKNNKKVVFRLCQTC